MQILSNCGAAFLLSTLAATPAVSTEVQVDVKGVHLCCQKCVNAVDDALVEVKGVKHEIDQDEATVSITACCVPVAQRAIDAIAAAGFHGRLNHKEVHFNPVHPPRGIVSRLELVGVHNCCGGCSDAIKKALASVKGVQADTVKPKKRSFVVEGEFKAAEVIEAVFNAGFHCDVKK